MNRTAAMKASMIPSSPAIASRRAEAPPVNRSVDRLEDVQVDAASGLHIGTIRIGTQTLRVGIRPVSQAKVPTAGPPLLLFNGIGANMELAGLLISQLDAIETIVFDLPGAGKSPPPKLPYRLFTMARLARDLLDELGYGRVDVMGVSWGGGLAQQFAIQYPKRVRRLVLAATAMGGVTMVPGHPRVLLKMVNPRRYLDKGYMKSVAPELYGGACATTRTRSSSSPTTRAVVTAKATATSCWRCSAGPACPGCRASGIPRWYWRGRTTRWSR
jgi:pimeloyl-ACP methyl ester carboxylesterase